MGRQYVLEVPFPFQGLHEGASYHNQPKMTAPVAKNVRGWEPRSGRQRGGSRAGLTKYLSSRFSTNPIQNINHVVEPDTTTNTASGTSQTVMRATASQEWGLVDSAGSLTEFDAAGLTYYDSDWDDDGAVYVAFKDGSNNLIVRKFNSSGVQQWTTTLETNADRVPMGLRVSSDDIVYCWTGDNDSTSRLFRLSASTGSNQDGASAWLDEGDGLLTANKPGVASGSGSVALIGRQPGMAVTGNRVGLYGVKNDGANDNSTNLQILNRATGAVVDDIEVHAESGNADDEIGASGIVADELGFFYVGTSVYDDGAAATRVRIMKFGQDGGAAIWTYSEASAAIADLGYDFANKKLYAGGTNLGASNHTLVEIDRDDGTVTTGKSVNGSNAVIACKPDVDGAIICATTAGRIEKVPANLGASTWTLTSGSTLQYKISVNARYVVGTTFSLRTVTNIAAVDGSLYKFSSSAITAVTSGQGVLDVHPWLVQSQEAFRKLYYVDGSNYVVYNPATNTAATWTPSAGSLPVSSSTRARLMCLWRGRIVLSGVQDDPHNWFMSKVGDPLDWDYAPATTTVQDAVAGNNARAGLVGDIVTALVPLSDEILLIGGDHALWRMLGDPADGGRIDQISDVTGMAWGRAWTIGPHGEIYFWGTRGGVYRLDPGGSSRPVSISDSRLKDRFKAINLSTHKVLLSWDDLDVGLHVWIIPISDTAATHYFWDARGGEGGAWYLDSFADTDFDPNSVHQFDADSPSDRVFMLGCRDGYIRVWNQDANDDDGTAISSEVWLGPLKPKGALGELILDELQCTLASGSGSVTYTVYAAQGAEAAVNATARFSGTWSTAGKNRSERRRARGEAIWIKLTANTAAASWALESLQARVIEVGRAGQRSLARSS